MNESELFDAIEREDIQDIIRLLDSGKNIESRDMFDNTPLLSAVEQGMLDVAELLIDRGANIEALQYHRSTALMLAVDVNDIEMVKLLLDRGSDINARVDGSTVLHRALATIRSDYDMVSFLISRGADVNSRDKNGNTPLLMAAPQNNKEIMELLISNGADVNSVDEDGVTPLLAVASSGNDKEIVKLLLDRGADINAVDREGMTVLDRSLNSDIAPDDDIIYLLISRGSDVNNRDKRGVTPLFRAVLLGDIDIIETLLDSGADVDARTNDGNTAIMAAKDNTDISTEDRHYIIELLRRYNSRRTIFKDKLRNTTEWMEICRLLGEHKITELRDIIRNHVTHLNLDQVRAYFNFPRGYIDQFYVYIDTLNKRTLCAYLATYFDHPVNANYEYNCINDSTFGGDLFKSLPPERVITIKQANQVFCFDVVEVGSFEGKNPYNNMELPQDFLDRAEQMRRGLPKDISELVQHRVKTPLQIEVENLQNQVEKVIRKFPREKFSRLTRAGLLRLAVNLSTYDPQFRLNKYNEVADNIMMSKRYILTKVLQNKKSLGLALRNFFL